MDSIKSFILFLVSFSVDMLRLHYVTDRKIKSILVWFVEYPLVLLSLAYAVIFFFRPVRKKWWQFLLVLPVILWWCCFIYKLATIR